MYWPSQQVIGLGRRHPTLATGLAFVVCLLVAAPSYADYESTILSDNPLGYWRLGDVPGPTVTDSSGNGIDGTAAGGVAFGEPGAIAGDADKAMDFDGLTGIVDFGFQSSLNLHNDFTLEVWSKPESLSSGEAHDRFLSNIGTGSGYGFGFNGSRLLFTTFGNKDHYSPHGAVTAGDWQHFVVVFDANNDANFYVNGSFFATVAGSQGADSSPGSFTIGSLDHSSKQPHNGPLDEVAVYDRSLHAAEIEHHYLAGIGISQTLSNASFSTGTEEDVLDIDFGTMIANDPAAPVGFDVANLLSSPHTTQLIFDSLNASGNTALLTTDFTMDTLVGGDSQSFNAMFNTSMLGSANATYEFSFTDALHSQQTITLNLTGEVVLPDNTPEIPDLVYNAVTGEVIVDPDGSSIVGYTLQNSTNSFLPGGHTPVLGGVATSTSLTLAEAAAAAITSPASIGLVFPTGMDIVDLYNLLGTNQVSRSIGAPLVPFDLVVLGAGPAVPEPSTCAMATLGLLGLGFVHVRRRRRA